MEEIEGRGVGNRGVGRSCEEVVEEEGEDWEEFEEVEEEEGER